MKKILVFLIGVSLSALVYSCVQDDETSNSISFSEFPQYDLQVYGDGNYYEFPRHQNCCECSTSACSTRKCCSGGYDCTCTCVSRWFGQSECNCSRCVNSDGFFQIFLTEDQFQVWNEFAGILATEQSQSAGAAYNAHLLSLQGIDENSVETYKLGKMQLDSIAPNLQHQTRVLINSFLDKYNFEDEKL